MTVIAAKKETTVTPQVAGYEAQGYALAQTVIAECKGQQNTWSRYAAKLATLHDKARDEFMKVLRKHVSEMREHVKAKEGQPEHITYKKAAASAQVQISNLMAVAKAMNNGYELKIQRDPETGAPLVNTIGDHIPVLPFYSIVAEARVFMGVEERVHQAGRPKKPWLDKLKKFILDNQPDFAANVDQTVELIEAMAKLTKNAKKAGDALL